MHKFIDVRPEPHREILGYFPLDEKTITGGWAVACYNDEEEYQCWCLLNVDPHDISRGQITANPVKWCYLSELDDSIQFLPHPDNYDAWLCCYLGDKLVGTITANDNGEWTAKCLKNTGIWLESTICTQATSAAEREKVILFCKNILIQYIKTFTV